MTTEEREFEIDPDSEEMRELEEWLSTIEVESLTYNKFKIKYDRSELAKNKRLRTNVWLWLIWYWRLNEARLEHEQIKEAQKRVYYAR